ncbi:GT2 family glycosyltransferase [Halopolyspora algeriensis]|uniref:GT2 family glycosyltransferase n=1 Tax=Halopolyspora algeriensis TaxID=1500506 RepID=A0A368VYF0_9ACTN|nr:glycosyltransferase [Halopolyspora algeriensis]RCW44604.1 GT2 family glycosyltransferase [Halopolyspora algeriensis]TQM55965.1 GT2 family glycosyltransferase [Halopolyspora algeriensis]
MTAGREGDAKVTVAVMTHNRREEVLRTLEHMTALPDAAPIIVVDNASADGTAEAVATHHPQVLLLRSRANLGAVARNRAVEHVDTPYVAFCDDDVRWQPGALSRAAELLDRYPALAAVTGRCLVEPDLAEDPLTPEMRESPIPAPPWLPGPAVLGGLAGTTMFRTAPFREVGGYSTRLWFCGEEELLSIDLAARGWWTCFAEDVLVHHSPSEARDSGWRRRIGIRNTLWTTWLRRPWRSVLRRSAAVLSSSPKDAPTLRAVAEAARGLPWVLRERQVVPARVERDLCLLEEPQRNSRARRYVG